MKNNVTRVQQQHWHAQVSKEDMGGLTKNGDKNYECLFGAVPPHPL